VIAAPRPMFRTAVARRKKQTIEVYVFSTPSSLRVPIALEKLGLTVSASGPRGYSDYPALQPATAKALVLEAFDTRSPLNEEANIR
jgi:hypothetical protein